MFRNYVLSPTVKPKSNFIVAEEIDALQKAMKGLGTDEKKIISVLTSCNNLQRQEIVAAYKDKFKKDLEQELRSELSGNFESLIIGLLRSPVEYLVYQLNKSFEGVGTDSNAIIEILVTKSNEEIKQLAITYEKLFKRPLVEHLCGETSGDFRKLLTLIVTSTRKYYSHNESEGESRKLAEELFKAGEKKLGTDEDVFLNVFGHESYEKIRKIIEEYKNISGKTIEQALKSELSGDFLKLVLAIVECVQNRTAYFAKQLNEADDKTLTRILISRSEIDLGDIMKEYERLYDRTLKSDIQKKTSGDLEKGLLALLGE